MKKDLLMVKELAAKLHMSPKSIQRVYRKGIYPFNGGVAWLGSISPKFDGRWNATDEAACVVSTATRHRRARPPARAGGAHSRNAPVR